MPISITIDHTLCQGHGQCQDVAPNIFEVRDDSLAYVVGPVDDAMLSLVQDAASRCPADAITITAS